MSIDARPSSSIGSTPSVHQLSSTYIDPLTFVRRRSSLTRSQVTGVKPQVRVSQSQVAELKLGSTLPTPNSRKG
jgi:hypothetical protein